MADFVVVAEYRVRPAEGIQVVSKTLIDGLRDAGHRVRVVPPRRMALWWGLLVLAQPRRVVFTHGPGTGVVLWSMLLRALTRSRIIWVATRPELRAVPSLLMGRPTAHVVVANSPRAELLRCAPGARFLQQFIGIDPDRLGSSEDDGPGWPEFDNAVPTALHVGHLRHNRGLDLLMEIKRRTGDRAQVVVLASPTFPADPGIAEDLAAAGVVVRREFVDNLAPLYRNADLYVFPVRQEVGGAIDLPLGVLEAVACGTPVVSTPFGALPAALADVAGVRIVETSDYAEVVSAALLAEVPPIPAPRGLPDALHAKHVTRAVLEAAGVAA